MIARLWHGRVRREDAAKYHDVVAATGLEDYGASAGIHGIYYLQRHEGDVTHVVTLTFWDSWDAIRAFAGEDVERAKYYPEDDAYLLEKEPTVVHYEVVDALLREGGGPRP